MQGGSVKKESIKKILLIEKFVLPKEIDIYNRYIWRDKYGKVLKKWSIKTGWWTPIYFYNLNDKNKQIYIIDYSEKLDLYYTSDSIIDLTVLIKNESTGEINTNILFDKLGWILAD